MAKIDKTGDAAIMPLHKILMKMCGQTGYTPDAVFEGLLDYIIGYLNPSLTPEPIEGWKFKPQDTATFHEMMQTVFRIYSEEIPRRRWYDPFGDLYMAIHAGGGGKGQFFTPPSVAQCVANVPSIRNEMDPMRFVATRLWAMRGSADRKTLDNEPPTDRKKSEDVLPLGGGEQSQESGVSDFTPETPLSDPVQPKDNKQPVQLELW